MNMARIRSIKPEFFDDEDLCDLGPWHRLCFAGLWTQADREGRLEDRPRRLKSKIFPYDDLDIEELLSDLAAHQFIVRYIVEGRHYIGIPETSWKEHQRPRNDEHESLFPAISCAVETYTSLNSDGSVSTKSVGNRKVGSREVRNVGGQEYARADTDSSLRSVEVNAISSPLIQRRNNRFVHEGRVPVWDWQHREFKLRLGGDTPANDDRLHAFYAKVETRWESEHYTPSGQPKDEWLREFQREFGSPTTATSKTAGNAGVVQRFIERSTM